MKKFVFISPVLLLLVFTPWRGSGATAPQEPNSQEKHCFNDRLKLTFAEDRQAISKWGKYEVPQDYYSNIGLRIVCDGPVINNRILEDSPDRGLIPDLERVESSFGASSKLVVSRMMTVFPRPSSVPEEPMLVKNVKFDVVVNSWIIGLGSLPLKVFWYDLDGKTIQEETVAGVTLAPKTFSVTHAGEVAGFSIGFDAAFLGGGGQGEYAISNLAFDRVRPSLIVFIGGFLDSSLNGNVKEQIYDAFEPTTNQRKQYFTWTDKSAAADFILSELKKDPATAITLVGHSFGADTALLIAQALKGVDISLLVTLDPVADRCRTAQIRKPVNVREWFNIWVDVAGDGSGNFWARRGGHCGQQSGATSNRFLPGYPHAAAANMFADEIGHVHDIGCTADINDDDRIKQVPNLRPDWSFLVPENKAFPSRRKGR